MNGRDGRDRGRKIMQTKTVTRSKQRKKKEKMKRGRKKNYKNTTSKGKRQVCE